MIPEKTSHRILYSDEIQLTSIEAGSLRVKSENDSVLREESMPISLGVCSILGKRNETLSRDDVLEKSIL